ncbi:MAG: hypothetical protein IJW37_00125, partial [Lachnospiraceae bacterium]|nr:hypothetical protein [Lachnospiraceae bacterium]
MNTKMKMRMLSLLLCFVMLICLMPATALAADTYTVTVTGGTASPAGPYTVDTEVIVTADPDPEGKKFKEWQIEGLSTTTSESRSIFFYMPANNVTITAIYEDANIIIESASATITEPVVGANPDFNIVSADESKYTVTVVKWNLLDGSSYPVLTAGDKFVRGESYQLDVKFVANPGYEFSDSCVYNVNGVPRAAYSLTKGERRCYFDVYEIIDTINVKGVVAPVAGATPDVSGITSDTDGINVIDVKWRDKDGYAFEGNPFVAGEKYILWLKYETESGYKVADDAEVTFNISDSNILDKEITHPIIKMTYEVPAASIPTTYTVTVNGGTASPAGPNTEGTEVTITATPPANMGFKQWNGLDGVTFVDDTDNQSATATFRMPAKAVTATAVYGINNVIATATGNIKPVLGNNAETNPTFTYNFPELETRYNSCWRYSSDGEDFQYAGYVAGTEKFCVGYWRFDLDVDLNGLSICNPCTVTVNGTKWQFVSSVRLMAESPVYYLDAEGNVSVVMFEIDGVTASCPAMPESLSAEDTLPHLAFTPTPSQAVVRGDGTWQKKSGDTWVNVSGAAQAGNTYRYKTLMHIDSSTTTHTFTNDVTLKVNGTSWTVDYTTMQETGTSSVSVMVYSPEYTVAETYTVTFDANSGTGTMTPVTGVSGEYELPACTFTAPSGKKFKAWSVDGVEKAVGDKITVTADTTVTAVWENVSEYTKKGDISAVEATAVLPPVLGATTYTSVTITDPTDAAAKGVRISGTSWYKKDASSIYGWTQCSNGVDTFEEGTYRLEVQLRSESNDAKEYYAMSDATTFTVNGVQWSGKELFRDYYASSGYGYRFFVSPEFTLGGKTLDSIAVTTPPTKTAYREGEDFNPAGMVVTATYTDSSTAPVILYTVTDGTDMAACKTSVTISYTEGVVTETTTQPITVAKEYIVTVNGGTGNGEY